MELDHKSIHIFCDGASLVHKGKVGGWSAVMIYKNEIREISGAVDKTTNNQMELLACIKALEKIKTSHLPINLYSDSSYVIDGMNEWRYNWIANGWKSNKKSVKNRELWERLISLANEQNDLTFVKVKGHAGVEYNERADELATNAIQDFLENE